MTTEQQLSEAKTEIKRLIGNSISKTITGEAAADQIEEIYRSIIDKILYPGEPGRLHAYRTSQDKLMEQHFTHTEKNK